VKVKIFAAVLVSLLMVGCATPNMKYSVPTTTVFESRSDKALVYFIRPNQLGWAINAAVYDDEDFIGFVPYNQKLPYFAEPGRHMFMVVSEAADFMKADIAAGNTYYVQVVPRMGAWRARFSLAPITKEDLKTEKVQKWISNTQLIENKDGADQWAIDNAPSVMQKKTAYLEKWNAKGEAKQPYLKVDDCE
jgi:hypothetical protein